MNKTISSINFEAIQNMSLADTSRYIKKTLKGIFSSIKFSVTSKCQYGIYIRFTETEEVSKQDIINIVGTFSKYTYQTLHVNNSIIYYSSTDIYKEEQRIKYEQQQRELKAEQQTREKLYNDNITVDGIHNAKVINVEDKDIFVIALEPSINKNDWKVDNDECIDEESYTTKYKITDIVELNEAEYNYFCFKLLENFDFLEHKGGSCVDDDTEELLYNYAVAITCEGKETLIIDPQGFSYARYTCRLVKDIDKKLEGEIKHSNNTIDTLNSIINSIDNTSLYIYSTNLSNYLQNKIINDDRFIYNDYDSTIIITGLAYKELIKKGIGVDANLNKVTMSIDTLLSCILKFETGQCCDLFDTLNPEIQEIKFSERLKNELKRANNKPTPEPPKPTKKDTVEPPEFDSNINNTNIQDNTQSTSNIVSVDFNKRTVKASKTKNNNTNWKQDQATKKQLWALHCITKLNTTNLQITKGQASALISKSKKGTNITIDIKQLLQDRQSLQA